MIVVDSSALVAIALLEPGSPELKGALDTEQFAIGWPTLLECRIVLERKCVYRPEVFLSDFLLTKRAAKIAFGEDHYAFAESAFKIYGKGRGHPAQLNYGDCMTYAVAMALNAPLLFKGGDFAKTDIRVHPASIPG